MRINIRSCLTTGLLAVLCFSQPAPAQTQDKMVAIWSESDGSTTMESTVEPGTTFTFVKESTSGTSPKFEVRDGSGSLWRVKLGVEVKSETAATHLLAAVGYFVDDDYYRARINVRGIGHLKRGARFVNGDEVIDARLERARDRKSEQMETWGWYDNPFVGTREFNGLRVMMALINNWDLKQINNEAVDGKYEVADLGASFGETGNYFTRSKAKLTDYSATRFIAKVTPEYVDLVIHSRPFLLSIFDVRNYRTRTRMETVAKRIPITDARWIGERLGRIPPEQIRDIFRNAGFSAVEVDGYSRVVLKRINELKRLGDGVKF